jgi:hypothetical protein
MRSTFALCLVVTALALACSSPAEKAAKAAPADRPAAAGTETAAVPGSGTETAAVEKCEHGVDKTLCTRCDPRLEAVFKAKGDWCAEHARPESQCALCHPELAALGVK